MKLEKEVSKFIRFAEVLPNNPTSQKILKEREEIKAAEDERIRIVSYIFTAFKFCNLNGLSLLIRKLRNKTKLRRTAREKRTLSNRNAT